MKAILLAAGQGKRLRPITEWVPKPLLPVGGRPIIETLLTNLRAAGIDEVVVVVGHLGNVLRRFLGDHAESGKRDRAYGVRLIYREQLERLGMAHAVMQAMDVITARDDDTMVLAGDTAFGPAHIGGLMDFHRRSGADVSLSLKRVPPERLSATSSVVLQPDDAIPFTVGGRVTHIVEKPAPGTAPSATQSGLDLVAAAPLYIYPPSLADYLPRVGLSARGEYELADVIAMMIADGLRVMGQLAPTAPNFTDQRDLLRWNFDYLAALLSRNL
jgi:NDP-sugar pyrophosphorylase family protein